MKEKIGNVLKTAGKVWTSLVFVFAIILLGIRFIPPIFGVQPIWCMSNSMAPAFHEGALCYIDTNYDTATVETGDIIAYQLANGALVTHRVHDITEEGIITKGDANANVDFAPITRDQIVGENVLQIEYLGNLFKDFPNALLISIVVFSVAVMLTLDTLTDILLDDEGGKKENETNEESSEAGEEAANADEEAT
jgi:signal peptidase